MTVFYWTTKGSAAARPIYGLHPSGSPVNGGLPEGVAGVEIASPPSGCEFTHVVDATMVPTLVLDPAGDTRAGAEADAAFTVKAIKALAVALGTHPALGLSSAELRARFLAAWKTLP